MRAAVFGAVITLASVGSAIADDFVLVGADKASAMLVDLTSIKLDPIYKTYTAWSLSVWGETQLAGAIRYDYQLSKAVFDCQNDTITVGYTTGYTFTGNSSVISQSGDLKQPVVPGSWGAEAENVVCGRKKIDPRDILAASNDVMAHAGRDTVLDLRKR